jgi:uncharacterized protein (DUF433 family)
MKQLEDYFDFSGPNPVRIKGHRVGINLILEDFKSGKSAEEIAAALPTIRLEDVYATITYYLQNQQQLDRWLQALEEWAQQDIRKKQIHPSPVVRRLRGMKA